MWATVPVILLKRYETKKSMRALHRSMGRSGPTHSRRSRAIGEHSSLLRAKDVPGLGLNGYERRRITIPVNSSQAQHHRLTRGQTRPPPGSMLNYRRYNRQRVNVNVSRYTETNLFEPHRARRDEIQPWYVLKRTWSFWPQQSVRQVTCQAGLPRT
jgi:hypothetical protein